MANSSHVRRSLSPPSQSRPNSAFQWPVPTSPATKEDEPDITVKQILERYRDDPDLLRHILMAKAEEDKVNWVYFQCENGIYLNCVLGYV